MDMETRPLGSAHLSVLTCVMREERTEQEVSFSLK